MTLIILIIISLSVFEYFFLKNKKEEIAFGGTELRINKSIYFLGFVVVILSFFMFSIPLFYQSEPDFHEMLIAMSIVGLLFFLIGNYCIFLYNKSKISILENGFEVTSVFEKKTVYWDDIKSVKVDFFKKELIFVTSNQIKCSLYYNGLNKLLHLVEIKTKIDTTNITNKIR